jgi:alkylation response protein AidB-like acyl-CoA dehydrogenase
MDFSRVELTPEDDQLVDDVHALVDEYVTDEVRDDVHRTGMDFYEPLLLAMGERGWILPERSPDEGGAGMSPFQAELMKLWLDRLHAPLTGAGTTKLVLLAIEAHAQSDVIAEVVPEIAAGRVRTALGYTEPDHGSDIASARTRAVRDGDEWVINGAKMFTTDAPYAQYIFLLTRSNPDVPKHKGLTMFLVPTETPGIEIRPMRTIGGERTNVVYLEDVRISDRYRLGPVDGGWRVLLGPLNAEHGEGREGRQIGPASAVGTLAQRPFHGAFQAAVAWAQTAGEDGSRPLDDPVTRDRLARVAIELEAMANTADPFGRVYAANACIRNSAELLNIVGPGALVAHDEDGALEDGMFEFVHRWAQGTSIYGGTVEIFKNIIAQHILGLPRQLPASN